MPRVIHFEIPAADPERASKFYAAVFDWKINRWPGTAPYWLVMTGETTNPGINGAITQKSRTNSFTVNTIDVPSLDEYLKKVVQAAGKVITSKMAIPGIGYMAYCQDTEENMFGIMQADKSAR